VILGSRTFAQARAHLTDHPGIARLPGGIDAWVARSVRAFAERAEDAIHEGHPRAFWRGYPVPADPDREHDVSTPRACIPPAGA
jgi:hypothetical protein